MRTKLLMILFLCLPLSLTASNAGDNGYDDIDGFFGYCSRLKSPGLRYTYISSQMIKRVSALPMGDFDLKPISDKIDFVQSVYVVTEFDSSRRALPDVPATLTPRHIPSTIGTKLIESTSV